eukprot:GEZU01014328.1.p1 GENE.GEZU01014328.1~~GEZU01014328.1.p1  ORF type:complete len:409 (-),score=52.61 GEZU01014328.1:123-1349(-)
MLKPQWANWFSSRTIPSITTRLSSLTTKTCNKIYYYPPLPCHHHHHHYYRLRTRFSTTPHKEPSLSASFSIIATRSLRSLHSPRRSSTHAFSPSCFDTRSSSSSTSTTFFGDDQHDPRDSTKPVLPLGFWKDRANHKQFFDWAAKRLRVQQPDDWYKISRAELFRLGGGSTIVNNYYGGSLMQALSAVYPEHEWLPWRFSTSPPGFWKDLNNQRRFFDWAARQLHISNLDQWYSVRPEVDFPKRLGCTAKGLLERYDRSLFRALSAVYPEHEWLPWRFAALSKQALAAMWADKANHRRLFDWIAKQLRVDVKQQDDWARRRVTREDVYRLGGGEILKTHYGDSLFRALSELYPEYKQEQEAGGGGGGVELGLRKLLADDSRPTEDEGRVADEGRLPPPPLLLLVAAEL